MPDTNLLLLVVGSIIGLATGYFALGSRAFRLAREDREALRKTAAPDRRAPSAADV